MQLVKHSLQPARRHNRPFQLNTDRKFTRERIRPLPGFLLRLYEVNMRWRISIVSEKILKISALRAILFLKELL